jgi:hypothetical protein
LEGQLVVADSLGEHRHHAPGSQQRVAGGERRHVVVSRLGIDRPVHRDHPRQLQERPQGRDLEQGGLAQESGVTTEGGHEKKAVDEPVRVVGHQDDRTRVWEVLAVLDLDAAEEDADQKTRQRGH